METGEGVAAAKQIEAVKKGKIKVSVRDQCSGKRVAGATIIVNGATKQSSAQEDIVFEEQNIGAAKVKVNKHFKEADYKTFITHKPKIVMNWEAKSSESDIVSVVEDKESTARVDITVYRVIESVRFCRKHLKLKPLDYGHWWIEVGDRSYGWWPREGELGAKEMEEPQPPPPLPESASTAAKIAHMAEKATYQARAAQYAANNSMVGAYGQAFYKTFRGVPGVLNGSEERRLREKDPYHLSWREGKTDEDYHPVIVDCRTDAEIQQAIRKFALSYSGDWSWRLEFGKNCHSFQVEAMKQLKLDKVKEL